MHVFDFLLWWLNMSSFPTFRVTYLSHVCGKSVFIYVTAVRRKIMLSLIKGWYDLSILSQPRVVKYSNSALTTPKFARKIDCLISLTLFLKHKAIKHKLI